MELNIKELLGGEVKRIPFDYELGLCDISFPDVALPSPAHVTGEVTDRMGYVLLSFHVSLPYKTACARCLEPVEGVFELSAERPLATETTLDSEDNEEYVQVIGGILGLNEPVLEQIIIEFPIRFLCSEDCPGLCRKCGKRLSEGDCGCDKNESDPRLTHIAEKLGEMLALANTEDTDKQQ